jgi:hypothetical protein
MGAVQAEPLRELHRRQARGLLEADVERRRAQARAARDRLDLQRFGEVLLDEANGPGHAFHAPVPFDAISKDRPCRTTENQVVEFPEETRRENPPVGIRFGDLEET